jgi:hypothetical protein
LKKRLGQFLCSSSERGVRMKAYESIARRIKKAQI